MSKKWYVYESDMDSYHSASPITQGTGWCVGPKELREEARSACAAATWAGVPEYGDEVRYCVLPGAGEDIAYYVGFSEGWGVVVSPVPLGWMPVDARRGVFQQVSK